MTRPLISSTGSIQLSVTAARKLRADVMLSEAPWNALQLKSDGLYLKKFSPVGALVQQLAFAGGQVLPIYGSGAIPSSSVVNYTNVYEDNGVAETGAAMFDFANPARITCQRQGRYVVSSHGRFKSAGTFSQFTFAAWISLNGDESVPLANAAAVTPAADPGALAAPLGQGTGVGGEVYTGAYDVLNVVTLNAGDYIETRLCFLSAAASPANTIQLNSLATIANPNANVPTQTMAMVQVASA